VETCLSDTEITLNTVLFTTAIDIVNTLAAGKRRLRFSSDDD